MKKDNYKVFMHAQVVVDIVRDSYHFIDEIEYFDEAYKLMMENRGYLLDDIIEIMMEKAQDENLHNQEEEYNHNSTCDPAFAGWEDCNRQFV
jgi:hypothetical protein